MTEEDPGMGGNKTVSRQEQRAWKWQGGGGGVDGARGKREGEWSETNGGRISQAVN